MFVFSPIFRLSVVQNYGNRFCQSMRGTGFTEFSYCRPLPKERPSAKKIGPNRNTKADVESIFDPQIDNIDGYKEKIISTAASL